MDSATLAKNLTEVIVYPLLMLLIGVGLLVFVWGLIEFLWGMNASGDASKKEDGKRHMLWGIIGLFVMFSVEAILLLLANSICGGLSSCTKGF